MRCFAVLLVALAVCVSETVASAARPTLPVRGTRSTRAYWYPDGQLRRVVARNQWNTANLEIIAGTVGQVLPSLIRSPEGRGDPREDLGKLAEKVRELEEKVEALDKSIKGMEDSRKGMEDRVMQRLMDPGERFSITTQLHDKSRKAVMEGMKGVLEAAGKSVRLGESLVDDVGKIGLPDDARDKIAAGIREENKSLESLVDGLRKNEFFKGNLASPEPDKPNEP